MIQRTHQILKEIIMTKTPMTPAAAARIQAANSKKNGGQNPKGSFPAKAQKAAAKNSGKEPQDA